MKTYDALKELLDDKIKEIVKKGDINTTELENLYKAVDVIKDLCEIEEKSQHKDQEEYSMRSYRGGRGYGYVYDYPMGDYGHGSYRSMNYDGNSNYTNGRNGSYSRNGSEQMVNQLSEMWENASSEQERRAIKECIDKLNA